MRHHPTLCLMSFTFKDAVSMQSNSVGKKYFNLASSYSFFSKSGDHESKILWLQWNKIDLSAISFDDGDFRVRVRVSICRHHCEQDALHAGCVVCVSRLFIY